MLGKLAALVVLGLGIRSTSALKVNAGPKSGGLIPHVNHMPRDVSDKILDKMMEAGASDRQAANSKMDAKAMREHLASGIGERNIRMQNVKARKTTEKWALVWIHGANFTNWDTLIEDQFWFSGEPDETPPGVHDASLYISYPEAPEAKLTALGARAKKTKSWFDIQKYPLTVSAAPGYGCSLADAEKNTAIITKAIDDVVTGEGIPPERIVVAGFGQGGYMTLRAALNYPKKLAGAFVFAGALPYPLELLKKEKAETSLLQTDRANKDVPIYWLHGMNDDVYPQKLQAVGVANLRAMGFNVVADTCDCSHSADAKALESMGLFMDKLLAASQGDDAWSVAVGSHAWLWVFCIAAWMAM
jgi:phospholipase/carboxylesterase